MRSTRNPGRSAGLLYILMGIPAPFALLYLPGKLIVPGNAAATADKIAASETLFRLGIAAQLFSQILFVYLVLVLYDLFAGVDRRQASLMKALVLVSVPIGLVNEVSSVAALNLVRGADFLSAVGKPQRDALAMLFVKMHGSGIAISQIFWGLWLLPLGLLVYRSGFIPRVFGVLLLVNGVAYPILSLVYFLAPQYGPVAARFAMLPETGELWFMLWLLIKGAVPPPVVRDPALG